MKSGAARHKRGRGEGAPQGRDAVMRALIDAGTELFAEQGAAAASVRDIADRAGVNHGLVHRHFGSKERLLRAVLDDLARRIEAEILGTGSVAGGESLEGLFERTFVAVTRHPAYFRVLSRALLDGGVPEGLQSDFPVVGRLVRAAARARDAGELPRGADPKMIVAATVALGLGWLLFEPYLLAATGQRRLSEEHARQRLMETVLSLIPPAEAPARR